MSVSNEIFTFEGNFSGIHFISDITSVLAIHTLTVNCCLQNLIFVSKEKHYMSFLSLTVIQFVTEKMYIFVSGITKIKNKIK